MTSENPENVSYNPDILNCLANLSNDEVFTPPSIVGAMLDLLPEELFRNPETTFLDPACKSGVFLREIAKRLIAGLADEIPDLQERVDHILHNQLYGIAITELTSLMSRRTLYCSKYPQFRFSVSKFDNAEGNIRFRHTEHVWKNGKCVWCGASEENETYTREGMEVYAYEFIHTEDPKEIFGMKFDVVIGNPPYQLDDGGNNASAKPVYQFFVDQALKLNPRFLTMIIPARWYNGGKGLDEFRSRMLNSIQITRLVDYQNSKECFPGLNISGGVCYFLWQRQRPNADGCCITNVINGNTDTTTRKLNEFPVFIRHNKAVNIIKKIQSKGETTIVQNLSSRNPFGLATNVRGKETKAKGDLTLYSSRGIGFIKRSDVPQGEQYIDGFKVMISRTISGHPGEADKTGQFKIFASIRILKPSQVCTDSYIVAFLGGDVLQTTNLYKYLLTKFSRFLLLQTITSINMSREVYSLIPLQDFQMEWSDEALYKKYAFDDDEVQLIESLIKPMDPED